MNAAARFDESASATGSSMRPRGLFDGPFRAGPAQARPARAGRVGGTTGRDSRHGPALSSGRASPALMISCWAVFWAPVFGPCSGWPSWARPIFPALVTISRVDGWAPEKDGDNDGWAPGKDDSNAFHGKLPQSTHVNDGGCAGG